MATGLKRFSISIPPDMDLALHAIKEEAYHDNTWSEMIRDLIARGLIAQAK